MAITQLPPLSLYVHIPWCVKKCPYCDFNSHLAQSTIPEDAYIKALLEDLDEELPRIWGRAITSIFIGGGTPSLLSAKAINKLLSGIRARLPFLADTEVTMEANPGTVEAYKFEGFLDAGINRISLGVQSFNNQFLSTLGRIHNADEALQAFEIARKSGFSNINIDLMYGLPGQSISQPMEDLEIALELNPENLSLYQLTLEPNTTFHHQPPKNMADDDHLADISEQGLRLLEKYDFQRYEVSAFSRGGKQSCWHNTNYWQFGDYVGIGAGAHGKITRADTQQIIRTSKRRNPKDYLKESRSFVDNDREIQTQELPLEFMLNAMRLKNGVPKDLFYQSTGLLLAQIDHAIQKCISRGLLIENETHILPSVLGFRFLNDILNEFSDEAFPKLKNSSNIAIKQL